MATLTKFIYNYQGTDLGRIRTRAMLCHIYHYALHNRWYQARDLMMMSHLQEAIHLADVPTQVNAQSLSFTFIPNSHPATFLPNTHHLPAKFLPFTYHYTKFPPFTCHFPTIYVPLHQIPTIYLPLSYHLRTTTPNSHHLPATFLPFTYHYTKFSPFTCHFPTIYVPLHQIPTIYLPLSYHLRTTTPNSHHLPATFLVSSHLLYFLSSNEMTPRLSTPADLVQQSSCPVGYVCVPSWYDQGCP